MTVRIGKIELKSVQDLHTQEARTLVEQRVPEQQGSVFQDLGREPVTVLLSGFLFGDDVLSTLESLRAAQTKAEPQAFSADIAVGTELTEVVIEEVRVRQVAGYRNRYRFFMRLKEHVEPPQPAAAATAPVNASVAGDADAWGSGTVAAAGVLQDPASLPGALADNPGLLNHLDMGELSSSIAGNMDTLSAGSLDGMVASLANADPSKADSLFGKLKDAGSLGSMIMKYVQEGVDFVKNLDPQKMIGLVKAFAGALDFLKALAKVANAAGHVLDTIAHLELPKHVAILKSVGGAGP
jgi:DNA circularisation protein N-terminus